MFQVVKRNGEIADFSMGKISSAINKAFVAKEKNYSNDMIELLTLDREEIHIQCSTPRPIRLFWINWFLTVWHISDSVK